MIAVTIAAVATLVILGALAALLAAIAALVQAERRCDRIRRRARSAERLAATWQRRYDELGARFHRDVEAAITQALSVTETRVLPSTPIDPAEVDAAFTEMIRRLAQ